MCSRCGHEKFVEDIDEMIESGKYAWAERTLSGIKHTVELSQHATERQNQAVENIRNRSVRW